MTLRLARMTRRGFLGAVPPLAGLAACGRSRSGSDPPPLSLLVPAAERDVWGPLGAGFEAARPGVRVQLVEGPNDTDLRENLYTAALLAGDESFDLVLMDVTWMSKLAGAGWLLPLGEDLVAETAALLPAAVEAGRYRGRLYRVPTRTDVGVLYYRRDWLEEAGVAPPETFEDLVRVARALQSPPTVGASSGRGASTKGSSASSSRCSTDTADSGWMPRLSRWASTSRPPWPPSSSFARAEPAWPSARPGSRPTRKSRAVGCSRTGAPSSCGTGLTSGGWLKLRAHRSSAASACGRWSTSRGFRVRERSVVGGSGSHASAGSPTLRASSSAMRSRCPGSGRSASGAATLPPGSRLTRTRAGRREPLPRRPAADPRARRAATRHPPLRACLRHPAAAPERRPGGPRHGRRGHALGDPRDAAALRR